MMQTMADMFVLVLSVSYQRSLARVGYATQPSLGADSVNIIIFTSLSTGFVKLKIKMTPGIVFSC